MGRHDAARILQAGSRSLTARVLPDVSGIEATFDYSVPDGMQVEIGSIVRVDLHGRRVRGWVIDTDTTPPDGVRLLPISKLSGCGPDRELIDLSEWAVRRWTGRRSFYLGTASPERIVSGIPAARVRAAGEEPSWFVESPALLALPPAEDPTPIIEGAHVAGPALVIVPSRRSAQRLVDALRKRGHKDVVLHPEGWSAAAAGGVTVVGTRAAAWCPMPDIRSVVVVDAYDEGHQSEASPTWNAVDVVAERAARHKAALLLISAVPRLSLTAGRTLLPIDRERERRGWAPLHVVDLRKSDPHAGRYTHQLVELLRGERRVLCVLNRKGRAQLLVCAACDEVAVCVKCSSSLRATDSGDLVCRRCENSQPTICRNCSSMRLKQLRAGVSKVREELEALALRRVGEVTGETKELPNAQVLIGTEAVLHRVGRADAVVFLEFDQELLASRYRAAEDALVLLARASRIVGGRNRSGIVIVQTRLPDNEVIDAAVHADPARLHAVEEIRRRELGWPPFSALARVSGAGAAEYISTLPACDGVLGPDDNGNWLVRAPDAGTLADVLAAARRPKARVRIEVDPPRI